MTFPWLVLGVVGTTALAGLFGRLTKQWHIAAIASGAGIILLQHFYFRYTSDDAYISYRYAMNLADGLGRCGTRATRWRVTPTVGRDPRGTPLALTSSSVADGWVTRLLVVSVAGTYALTWDLLHSNPGRIAGFIACVLLTACGAWSLWATAGLEAPLFAASRSAQCCTPPRTAATWRRKRWPPCPGRYGPSWA